MGLLNIIRRMHLREKLSIREIARRTGLSRNTVTKHLAANTIEPKFATPERSSKLDPFFGEVGGLAEDGIREVAQNNGGP